MPYLELLDLRKWCPPSFRSPPPRRLTLREIYCGWVHDLKEGAAGQETSPRPFLARRARAKPMLVSTRSGTRAGYGQPIKLFRQSFVVQFEFRGS